MMGWHQGQAQVELLETLNGRIYWVNSQENGRFSSLMGMLQGSVASPLSNSYAYLTQGLHPEIVGIKGLLQTLQGNSMQTLGSVADALISSLETIRHTVAANGGATVNVEGTDMSGVVDGLADIGDNTYNANRLLAALDSTLSSGNGRILAALDSLSSGDCGGGRCGDYGGADSGAFSRIDTSGRYSGAGFDSLLSVPGVGGLRDSASVFASRIRSATATPFSDNVSCPAQSLSVDACGVFGSSCAVSLCDDMFYINGRHFFEWLGVFIEFFAWIVFLARIA
jgi:hypothetical protein